MIPRITTYISTEIAYKSFFKYIDAPIFIKDKNDFSEVQTTFALRTSQLTGGVIYPLLNILNSSLTLITFISYLLLKQTYATLITILMILIIYLIALAISKTKIKSHSNVLNLYGNYLFSFINSSLADKRYLYFNFDKNKLKSEFKKIDYKIRNSSTQLSFISSLPKIFIECLFFLGMLFIGIIIKNFGNNNLTNIPNLLIFLVCFQRLLPSIQVIYSNFINLKAYLPISNYFTEFLHIKDSYLNKNDEIYKSNRLIGKDLLLESTLLFYKYGKKTKQLSYPPLKINKNDFILIKGISGRGKSTWIDLLFGIRKPLKGKVNNYLDNKSVIYLNANVNNEDIENIFESYFYKLSNLFFSNKENSKLKKIRDICGINFLNYRNIREIKNLKNKKLSSGQYQRLQLFIALVLSPKLLILDESLNAIEIDLEHKILRNMKEILNDITVIQITHRPFEKIIFNKIYTL